MAEKLQFINTSIKRGLDKGFFLMYFWISTKKGIPMKSLFALVVLFFVSHLQAATVSFIEPCGEEALVTHEYELKGQESLGKVTINTLLELNIPHIGAELGINSIFNTAIDFAAYDIISKSEMRAYGWCYSINGIEPNKLASEILVEENDQIIWWYAFAHYKEGEWVSQCEPSYLTPLFCKKDQN